MRVCRMIKRVQRSYVVGGVLYRGGVVEKVQNAGILTIIHASENLVDVVNVV